MLTHNFIWCEVYNSCSNCGCRWKWRVITEEAWKIEGFNGIRIRELREIPVRCSTNWAMKSYNRSEVTNFGCERPSVFIICRLQKKTVGKKVAGPASAGCTFYGEKNSRMSVCNEQDCYKVSYKYEMLWAKTRKGRLKQDALPKIFQKYSNAKCLYRCLYEEQRRISQNWRYKLLCFNLHTRVRLTSQNRKAWSQLLPWQCQAGSE